MARGEKLMAGGRRSERSRQRGVVSEEWSERGVACATPCGWLSVRYLDQRLGARGNSLREAAVFENVAIYQLAQKLVPQLRCARRQHFLPSRR